MEGHYLKCIGAMACIISSMCDAARWCSDVHDYYIKMYRATKVEDYREGAQHMRDKLSIMTDLGADLGYQF